MADYFKRDERTRATVIYGLSGSLCALVGCMGAGWLNELYGWRTTFILLSIPGVILAALAWLTSREPRRTAPKSVLRRVDASTGHRRRTAC